MAPSVATALLWGFLLILWLQGCIAQHIGQFDANRSSISLVYKSHIGQGTIISTWGMHDLVAAKYQNVQVSRWSHQPHPLPESYCRALSLFSTTNP